MEMKNCPDFSWLDENNGSQMGVYNNKKKPSLVSAVFRVGLVN